MSDFAKTLARIGEIEDAYKLAPDQPNLLAACLRLFPAFRAADAEIKRLHAENERLREALEFYACDCEEGRCEFGDDGDDNVACGSRARAALKDGKPDAESPG